MFIDVFNGDADGLCALMQMRLAEPQVATLVTGVKRDNALLRQVTAGAGDSLLVLDITFDNNRVDVERLLAAGASIRYFDHHHPGDVVVNHPRLSLTIDESPLVCTSVLVNQALHGQFAQWAVVGAFGDNLPLVGTKLAETLGLDASQTAQLRELGELLNYNGYGSQIADLHFHPADLFRSLYIWQDPFKFVAGASEFARLKAGYAEDMAAAAALRPEQSNHETKERAAVYVLPDATWARRVIGVWANLLSQAHPEHAHLILCPNGTGAYTASVRSAVHRPQSAADFCRTFPGGGGRATAGGINHLPATEIDIVTKRFISTFS